MNDVNREYTEVLMELNINGIMDTAYSYGDQRLTNERFTEWTGYYTYDPRGSVTGVTDSKGMIWQSYRYNANGEITFGKPQYNNVYSYNAESYNPNIQAQYLRARYYSPETANFLTEDSYLGNIADPLTLNRYNYAKSSPLNYIDPSGHAVTPETVLDVVSAIDSAATLIADPSWVNAAFLLWDIGSAIIPVLPGSYVVKGAKLIGKFDNAADAVKTVSKAADALDDAGDIAQNARKVKKAGDFADLVLDSQKALDVGKVELDQSAFVADLKKQLSICEVKPDDWGNPVNRFDDILDDVNGTNKFNRQQIIDALKDAPIEYKRNPKTGVMEPYMKQIQMTDDYKVILRRDVGPFSHGDLDHWNLEVQTVEGGKVKYNLHMYLDEAGNILPFTEDNINIPTKSPFK